MIYKKYVYLYGSGEVRYYVEGYFINSDELYFTVL